MKRAANRSDWKGGFLFLGNELVLDFVNTRPIQDSKPMELLPDFGAVLRWFQAADLLEVEEFAADAKEGHTVASINRWPIHLAT